MSKVDIRIWYVYVIRSEVPRFSKAGKQLPGVHYAGCTTDIKRRLRQHNGEITGGSKYTSCHRPWILVAIYGTYTGQSDALKAERALKHGKRGTARTQWSSDDSEWFRELEPTDKLRELLL